MAFKNIKLILQTYLGLYRFRSPLLTASRLIFFLVTKMVQFTKFFHRKSVKTYINKVQFTVEDIRKSQFI